MKEYLIVPGLLDRSRKLILSDDYLEWENGDKKGNEFVSLKKSDIVDFKHGMDWIVWYKVSVGRRYSITFKKRDATEFEIIFRSYFGRRKEYSRIYSDIIDHIWKNYYTDVVDGYLDRFYNGEEIEIQGIRLNEDGILLREHPTRIPWSKVGLKDYYRYFAIFLLDDPNVHSRASFNEYGTECLWSSVRTILKDKELNAAGSD